MLLEGVLFAAGLTVTVVLGAPVASRLARPNSWTWLRRPVAQVPDRPKIETPRAFAPLDLGPDPMRWPSQRPWPASPLVEPQWPSQSWDDEHFGAHWRRPDAAAPSPPLAEMQPGASTPALLAAEEQFFKLDPLQPRLQEAHPPPPPPKPKPKPAAKAQTAPKPQPAPKAQAAPKQPKAQPRPQQATQPAPKAAPKAAPRSTAAGAPEKAELEAMVAQIGLAATVQKIMERTGWDFRQAAQHLARIRQGK